MTNTIEEGQGRRTIQGYLASVGSAAGYGFGTYFAYLVIRDGVPPMTATFFSLVFGLHAHGSSSSRVLPWST